MKPLTARWAGPKIGDLRSSQTQRRCEEAMTWPCRLSNFYSSQTMVDNFGLTLTPDFDGPERRGAHLRPIMQGAGNSNGPPAREDERWGMVKRAEAEAAIYWQGSLICTESVARSR